MSKNKYLYEFVVPREVEVDEIETVEGGTLTKKVKKSVDVSFAILSPNRRVIDDAELFYGVRLAEAIKAGLMPKALLAKRFANDDGVLTEAEVQEMSVLRNRLYELSNIATRLSIKVKSELSDEEKAALESAIDEIGEIQNKLQNYEIAQASLYENTAEVRARNKTIFWYVLQLSLQKNARKEGNSIKEEYEPIFKGKTFEDKLVSYDKLEEDADECLRLAIQRFVYFITFFYYGRASSFEEFAALDKSLKGEKVEDKEENEVIAETVAEIPVVEPTPSVIESPSE